MQEQQLNKRHQRRAVAPIIATLLMVAISVVGGILIFVFAQDFFADTSTITPTFDNIKIFGYDTSDVTGGNNMQTANGTPVDCATMAAGGDVENDDCIFLYVRNLGDKSVVIEEVRVFGERYTIDTGSVGDGTPDEGEFQVMNADGSKGSSGIIEPNADATIAIAFDGTLTADIKVGRTIPVAVVTGSGLTVNANIISGVQRGGS